MTRRGIVDRSSLWSFPLPCIAGSASEQHVRLQCERNAVLAAWLRSPQCVVTGNQWTPASDRFPECEEAFLVLT